jgi:hypothetical protein
MEGLRMLQRDAMTLLGAMVRKREREREREREEEREG